jgi:hypothetical protein
MPSATTFDGHWGRGDWSSNWLLSLLAALADAEYDHCRARVAKLRTKYAGISDDDLANEIVRDASYWAAVVGAGVGAVHSMPGVGQAVAIGAVLPEVAYLAKLQATTAIQIALVYDYDLTREQIVLLTLACLTYSYAFDVVKESVKNAAVELTRRTVEKLISESAIVVAERASTGMALAVAKRGVLERVPLVAVPVGAVMNYGGLQLFGMVAIKYFSPSYTRCYGCGAIQAKRARFCSECGNAAGG